MTLTIFLTWALASLSSFRSISSSWSALSGHQPSADVCSVPRLTTWKCWHSKESPTLESTISTDTKYSIAVCTQPHHHRNWDATWDHTVLTDTTQRWHSCHYPSQLKLVLDVATQQECKAELADCILKWYTYLSTHPGTNWARYTVISLMRQTMLPLCQPPTIIVKTLKV